ncbi:hypothetical protein [Vibrio algarum]|uniref:Uncharacterized protein n=1 Tax=Vibrio algarum TaxID=3020714 RepID=A0ABT4YN56_9VIBR|nr:hypothetical protein [Vibrio sp. KJ40-1]MDB1122835.1 hypothetical protein [Vibrio sp. KJ40-1]
MPLILLYPLLGGAAGFAAGFFTGSSTKKLIAVTAVGGVGLYAYSKLKGGN